MTRGTAALVGFLLLAATLPATYAGQLRMGKASWFGLVGGLVLLSCAAAETGLGRHRQAWPRLEPTLVVVVLGSLVPYWVWFVSTDLVASRTTATLLAVPIGMLALPLLRWIGDGRRPWQFWGSIAAMSTLGSFAVADVMVRWLDYGLHGEERKLVGAVLLVVGPPTAMLVLGWGLVRLVNGGTGEPLHPLRTAVAGGVIGLMHAQIWLLVRLACIQETYLAVSEAYFLTTFTTVLVLYALGPSVVAVLLSPHNDRALSPVSAQT